MYKENPNQQHLLMFLEKILAWKIESQRLQDRANI